MARFLLSCGVDVDARNNQGKTAVDLASHAPLRDFLKQAGGRYGLHAVYYASKYGGDVAALSAALDAGASADEKRFGETPLFAASRSGALDSLRLLLSRGASESVDAVCDDITPLHASIAYQCIGEKPLLFQCTQLLLEAGANPSTASVTSKTTPLMTACMLKNEKSVQLLLQNGADPHAVDVDGNSAMHFAAGVGAVEAVRLLVSAGARADVRNAKGHDALQVALEAATMRAGHEALNVEAAPSKTLEIAEFSVLVAQDDLRSDETLATPALVRLLVDAGASLRSHEAADVPSKVVRSPANGAAKGGLGMR